MGTTDRRQFHRLVEPHLDALFRAAFRLTSNSADAEDLVQDTCYMALQRLAELRGRRTAKAWLLSMLYNRFVDGIRRTKRSPVTIEPVTTIARSACPKPTPEEEAICRQSEEGLHRAWLELEPSQRALLALRAEGYSPKEIAEITGVPVEALYARIYRARLNLAEHLKEPSANGSNHRLEIAK